MSSLRLDNVRKVYGEGDRKVVALNDVDLSVGDNEMLFVMGPSGAGKTTLLTVAGGLLRPTSGKVIVGGDDITKLGEKQLAAFRRDRIGFVFQAVNLVPFLTARENLLLVRQFGGGKIDKAAKKRADRLLDELSLGDRANNLPSQLSGGQQQRVAIGRALMNEPPLVLVDEPTSALDSELGQQVMQLLRDEITGRGLASVVVTHDNRVLDYADRIVQIVDGKLDTTDPRDQPESQSEQPSESTTDSERSPEAGSRSRTSSADVASAATAAAAISAADKSPTITTGSSADAKNDRAANPAAEPRDSADARPTPAANSSSNGSGEATDTASTRSVAVTPETAKPDTAKQGSDGAITSADDKLAQTAATNDETTSAAKTTSAKKPTAKKTTAKKATAKKTTKRNASKRSPAKKSPARKTTAKKAPAKKTTAKKSTAKKSATKKTTAKKTTAKKTSAKKASANKSATKKSAAKKSATKKTTAKKTTAKKTSAKKASAKKSAAKKST